ncbi:MAG: GNAT family N-acetyltransferase [Balneolaceae bacterium]
MEKSLIRNITPEETYDLRHRVMWPDHPIEYIILPEDQDGIHFGLFMERKLVSVVSLFITGNEAQFRKFATEIPEQGKGYGTQLLSYLIHFAESKGIQRIWCNARVDRTDFYKRFNFEKTNSTYSKGGIDFVILERVSPSSS